MVLIKKIRLKKAPEKVIQEDLIAFLRTREWFVKSTHGGAYQSGFPDLFAAKKRYGMRWIEVKNVENYRFTDAQLEVFPEFSKNGVGIWVLQGIKDYDNLFKPPNWHLFLSVFHVHTRSRSKKDPVVNRKTVGGGIEREIQDSIIEALKKENWYVLETHGSLYQKGFPDLYACKKGFGQRWIEVKRKSGYCFTGAQLETFPRLDCEGVGIWILQSNNLGLLSSPPNWRQFL